ncbi:MAG TPA: hypothetical protein VEB20_01380 [Azospirillaceae bacterium]|nr:hypothetical protein [Azospirillaceae bacterium]
MIGAKGALDAVGAGLQTLRAPQPNLARPAEAAAGEAASVFARVKESTERPEEARRAERAPRNEPDIRSDRVDLGRSALVASEAEAPKPDKPAAEVASEVSDADSDMKQRRAELESREAAQRLERAKQRMRVLQLQARLAAASGDPQEAARVAREASVVAREVGLATQELSNSKLGGGAGGKSPAKPDDEDGPPADVSEVAARAQAEIAAREGQGGGQVGAYFSDARSLAAQARTLIDQANRVRQDGSADGRSIGEELAELVSATGKMAEEAEQALSPEAASIGREFADLAAAADEEAEEEGRTLLRPEDAKSIGEKLAELTAAAAEDEARPVLAPGTARTPLFPAEPAAVEIPGVQAAAQEARRGDAGGREAPARALAPLPERAGQPGGTPRPGSLFEATV